MLAIFKREITSYFTSATGYLVMGLFLALNGLLLWVIRGPFNIFDNGFADLSGFFLLAPFIFLFLIPALTMKSFSEERKTGTLELLLIKPISPWQLVLGKFLGTFTLAIAAMMPTVIYVVCISALGTTQGNVDSGLVLGAYAGMFLLIGAYTAIGLFASVLTENQIVSFLVSLMICFAGYFGFSALAASIANGTLALFVSGLGMEAHFERMGRGILDTRDLLYFGSITYLFLFLTVHQLKTSSKK